MSCRRSRNARKLASSLHWSTDRKITMQGVEVSSRHAQLRVLDISQALSVSGKACTMVSNRMVRAKGSSCAPPRPTISRYTVLLASFQAWRPVCMLYTGVPMYICTYLGTYRIYISWYHPHVPPVYLRLVRDWSKVPQQLDCSRRTVHVSMQAPLGVAWDAQSAYAYASVSYHTTPLIFEYPRWG